MKKKRIFLVILNLIICFVVYFVITAVLILVVQPTKPNPDEVNISFNELFIDYSNLPQLKTFTARDGKQLGYRHYPAQSDKMLVLLHGSGWHSQYFLPLAEFISSEGLAQVYTPDLRGHGPAPERRGDVDYIDQLEDDVADFVAMVQEENPNATLIMGGHCSGGGLAVRFAGSQYGQQADAYLLMTPYLSYKGPTIRPKSGGWAYPYTARIIGLAMLNNLGIRWFNGLTVIEFNMPEEARNGTETLSYSYRLNTGYAPRNYKKDFRAITQPLLVVAGTADESFVVEQYEPVISQYTKVQVKLLQDVTHMGVVVGTEVRPVAKEWLEGLSKP